MKSIGRNDPCPCGSGKKYKKCHGVTVAPNSDSVYDRIRQLDGEATHRLIDFARQRYGEEALAKAWPQYHFGDDVPFDLSEPQGDPFLRWFTFNWRSEEKETLAELFLLQKGENVDKELYRFIRATVDAPYSFFQTLAVEPGVGATMRDILRRREFHITERSASKIMQPGLIMFARLVEMDGIHFFMGNGSSVIPPRFFDWLLHLRTFLESEGPFHDGSITSETLLAHEHDLRERYFEIEDALNDQKLELRNTDGDPLVLHTLTYKIPSFEVAFHALKDLEQKVMGWTDEEMLAEADVKENGEPAKLTLHWLRKGHKSGIGDNTSLATLSTSDSTLVVEVNSEKRSKRIRKEIKKRLGDNAVLLRTEIKSQEGLMKEVEERPRGEQPDKESEHDRLMKEAPEWRAIVEEMMKKHWANWLDTPVPALRGMTPRKAAKDPLGRELLESLLMDFELRNQSQTDPNLRVDTAKLKRELGLAGDQK